jgi:UDP-N-acetylmuramate: L-alanyl-gamma-D-glutamyl-meso-diaminopimelate ligase
MHYHLIGIAGTAMGSLAGLLREAGHRVTGSDEGVYPPMSTMLDGLGIEYAHSFRPGQPGAHPDVVVVGNAISRGNPELEAVLERRLYYTSAAHHQGGVPAHRRVLAVAGTHGKTTTTSILAWLLESAGLRPSFLIGGVAENFGTSFRLTDSDLFVIEADEYDTAYFDKGPKMWHYLPHVAVVANLEFDHADIYRDDIAYRFAFERFINLIPRNGTLVAGWESEVVRELAAKSLAPVESFALEPGAATGRPLVRGRDRLRPGRDPSSTSTGRRVPGRLPDPAGGRLQHPELPGGHRRGPGGGRQLGRDPGRAAHVPERASSHGASGRAARRVVIDDFAHHPTAVAGTIEAARQRFGADRRMVAIFEPRSYTAQRREFQEAYRRPSAARTASSSPGSSTPSGTTRPPAWTPTSWPPSSGRRRGRPPHPRRGRDRPHPRPRAGGGRRGADHVQRRVRRDPWQVDGGAGGAVVRDSSSRFEFEFDFRAARGVACP